MSSLREDPRAAAVVVAGGSGSRMGLPHGTRKQYIELDGVPVLRWTVQAFLDHPAIRTVIVVLPPADVAAPPAWLRGLRLNLVAGGEARSDSVRNGLARVPDACDVVLVHDGARPFVSADLIGRMVEAGTRGAAVAATRVVDTIKAADRNNYVVETRDREGLWQAQTPQAFPRELILEVHRRAAAESRSATDDAALCEAYGVPVLLVEGAPENLKITHPADLRLAEALARALPRPAPG